MSRQPENPQNIISAEKNETNTVTAPVEICVSSGNEATSIGNDFVVQKRLLDRDDRMKETASQIACANLAFLISNVFDKKFNVKAKSVSIYLSKCPCQRCQTLRRINRLRRDHQ